MNIKHGISIAVFCLSSPYTQAALFDRGNGLIYDSTLNITWIQDFQFAIASGYDPDGNMTYNQAKNLADELVFNNYNDWRLVSANLIGDRSIYDDLLTMPQSGYYDGSYDRSYNNTRNELGHLLQIDLGNKGIFTTTGVYEISGIGDDQFSFIEQTTGQQVSFLNAYIGGTWLAEGSGPGNYSWWAYSRDAQFQSPYYVGEMQAVLVRNGDSIASYGSTTFIPNEPAPVPVPSSWLLLLSGTLAIMPLIKQKVA